MAFSSRYQLLYSYLNLESTKTCFDFFFELIELYSYLNLESTKTDRLTGKAIEWLYSYLNLESTKTCLRYFKPLRCCTVT